MNVGSAAYLSKNSLQSAPISIRVQAFKSFNFSKASFQFQQKIKPQLRIWNIWIHQCNLDAAANMTFQSPFGRRGCLWVFQSDIFKCFWWQVWRDFSASASASGEMVRDFFLLATFLLARWWGIFLLAIFFIGWGTLIVEHSHLEARLLHRQGGTTVAKVPVPRSSSFQS